MRANNRYQHRCGGTVLKGPDHIYCDRCGAYTYDVEADALPTGSDQAANEAARDRGDEESSSDEGGKVTCAE